MSSDFDLFDDLPEEQPGECSLEKDCEHINTTETGGVVLCLDCGEEIDKTLSNDKEWRFYGQNDSKHSSDPNRCQLRRVEDKNIFKDVDSLGFNDRIISIANKIYSRVTKGKIHRGNSRKAIIFACIFHAFKISGKPQACENLIEVFKLDRKTALRGLKQVNLNIPKEDMLQNTSHITPANLIQDIMTKFGASDEQKQEVVDLFESIKHKSSKINRSRPQSIAAGLTYYWIQNKGKQISIKEFTEKVSLSELTVLRLAKDISDIFSS